MTLSVESDDSTWSDERVKRQLVDGVPALDEVERRIDVCPGVISERDDRDVVRVALRDPFEWLDPRGRLARPRHHVGTKGERKVMDFHGPTRVAHIPAE